MVYKISVIFFTLFGIFSIEKHWYIDIYLLLFQNRSFMDASIYFLTQVSYNQYISIRNLNVSKSIDTWKYWKWASLLRSLFWQNYFTRISGATDRMLAITISKLINIQITNLDFSGNSNIPDLLSRYVEKHPSILELVFQIF